jgi:hypothetical protein
MAGNSIRRAAFPNWNYANEATGVSAMADSGAGTGILGVLVGVMLVIFVGAAVLMATGKLGNSGPSLTIKMPGAK